MIARIMMFRRHLVALWFAFFNPRTPFYLKALTVLTALYVVSPIDIVPDFIPIVGWIDDIILVPLVVNWIVSRLPRDMQPNEKPARGPQNAKTVNGTARRV